jgi:hypothetical protein
MKLICGACERPAWLRADDLDGDNVDGKNDLTCPFCGARKLEAALPKEVRLRRQGRADHGVYG